MLSRRRFLQSSTAAAALAFWSPTALSALAQGGAGSGPPILINIFLRGGADMCALVPPVGDPACSASRSNPLAFGDGFFALHPQFAPLFNSIPRAEMTGVHAIHSDDTSKSHFNAMALTDRGNEVSGPGWMMAAALANGLSVPLNNVSLGTTVNPCMFGGPSATLSGVDELVEVADTFDAILPSIERMWAGQSVPDLLVNTAGDLFALVDDVSGFGPDNSEVDYPASAFESKPLREAARMIRESPAVAHIAINSGTINNGSRWDTHGGQLASLQSQVRGLAEALAAFRQDVGDDWNRIIVILQTEFGRTVTANNLTATGTQHGHAGAMLLLGGPIADSPFSGEITSAEWPGIARNQLLDGIYLHKTSDIRTVLAEVLVKHMRCQDIAAVFPTFDFAANPEIGVLAAAAKLGDVDGDGDLDGDDVSTVLDRVIDGSAQTMTSLADVDGDRSVTMRDAQLLARLLDS